MEGSVDGWTADRDIGRLGEWAGGGGRSDYRRRSQDTACYPRLLQDTFIDIMFNRNLT